MEQQGWAVCPKVDEAEAKGKPRIFPTVAKAKRFWMTPFRLPRALAIERKEALQKREIGEAPQGFYFPQHLVQRRPQGSGWHDPVPVCRVALSLGSRVASFADFLRPEEIGDIPEETLVGYMEKIVDDRLPQFSCYLADDWMFAAIEKDAAKRKGHNFEGRKYSNFPEIVVKAVYDFEASLKAVHGDVAPDSVADFYVSWQLWRHIASFCDQVGEYGRKQQKHPQNTWHWGSVALSVKNFVYTQLAAYAHDVRPSMTRASSTEVAEPEPSRKMVANSYFERHKNDRIKKLDVCWAVGQHYSEWKRWLRSNSPIKDGSTPDLAFRNILTSGKRPHEFRRQPRPDAWK